MSFQLSQTTGLILAGGLGTRLRPALENLPKVLAPVLGRPFLTLLLDQLLNAGVHQVVLCTGYLADQVRETIGDRYGKAKIFYSREEDPLGTAGAIRLGVGRFPAETILVMNGDSLLATHLNAFLEWYQTGSWQNALMLTWVDDAARFGTVEISEQGEVRAFREKQGIVMPGWINAGIYLLSRERVMMLPEGQALSLERSVFPQWTAENTDRSKVSGWFLRSSSFHRHWNARVACGRSPIHQTVRRETAIYKRFVILDRDGTLIVERNYLSSPAGVELLANAAEGLRRFEAMGWGRLVVTNQSGIGRRYFTRDTVDAIHDHMAQLLAQHGAAIDEIYVCPHTPEDACGCRKPKTGLLLQAAADWNFKPEDCVFIGDKACDIDLGRALGGTTILVLTGYGQEYYQTGLARPDYVARDLNEAVDMLMITDGQAP